MNTHPLVITKTLTLVNLANQLYRSKCWLIIGTRHPEMCVFELNPKMDLEFEGEPGYSCVLLGSSLHEYICLNTSELRWSSLRGYLDEGDHLYPLSTSQFTTLRRYILSYDNH